MPLINTSLKSKIDQELTNAGFVITGEHSSVSNMASAIAKAVVDEITENGLVVIAAGSSSGSHKIT
jgi:hypothetical protein